MRAHQTAGRLAEWLDGEVARVAGVLVFDAPVAHTHRVIVYFDAIAALSHNGARALVAPAAAQMTACASAAAHTEWPESLPCVKQYCSYLVTGVEKTTVRPFHAVLVAIVARAVH